MGENENAIAKREAIAAYFDRAEQRHAFLVRLLGDGHDPEAMTLCLTYIDSFAQWLFWPRCDSGRNFVEALSRIGDDPLFAAVHPLQLGRAFRGMRDPRPQFAARIETLYPGPRYELQDQPAVVVALEPHLQAAELQQARGELWRGTIAAIAYYRLRNPSVHSFGAAALSLDGATWRGRPVPDLDFQRLHPAAGRLIAEARHRSEANNQWFGNDAIVRDA